MKHSGFLLRNPRALILFSYLNHAPYRRLSWYIEKEDNGSKNILVTPPCTNFFICGLFSSFRVCGSPRIQKVRACTSRPCSSRASRANPSVLASGSLGSFKNKNWVNILLEFSCNYRKKSFKIAYRPTAFHTLPRYFLLFEYVALRRESPRIQNVRADSECPEALNYVWKGYFKFKLELKKQWKVFYNNKCNSHIANKYIDNTESKGLNKPPKVGT